MLNNSFRLGLRSLSLNASILVNFVQFGPFFTLEKRDSLTCKKYRLVLQ